MSQSAISSRPFTPGTTGWSVADLDDPQIEYLWFQGRFEIVEGVLTTMPAAYFAGGHALFNLLSIIREYFGRSGLPGRIAQEVDIVLNDSRILVADAAALMPDDLRAQQLATRAATIDAAARLRLLVPPTLIVESVSPGHETHDTLNKRRWYAEFGVPNYWILDAFKQTLQCLRLTANVYRVDTEGRRGAIIQPSVFQGLQINLAQVWME